MLMRAIIRMNRTLRVYTRYMADKVKVPCSSLEKCQQRHMANGWERERENLEALTRILIEDD